MYTDEGGFRVIEHPGNIMCGISFEFPLLSLNNFHLCKDENGWYLDDQMQHNIKLEEIELGLTSEDIVYLKLKYGI